MLTALGFLTPAITESEATDLPLAAANKSFVSHALGVLPDLLAGAILTQPVAECRKMSPGSVLLILYFISPCLRIAGPHYRAGNYGLRSGLRARSVHRPRPFPPAPQPMLR